MVLFTEAAPLLGLALALGLRRTYFKLAAGIATIDLVIGLILGLWLALDPPYCPGHFCGLTDALVGSVVVLVVGLGAIVAALFRPPSPR